MNGTISKTATSLGGYKINWYDAIVQGVLQGRTLFSITNWQIHHHILKAEEVIWTAKGSKKKKKLR